MRDAMRCALTVSAVGLLAGCSTFNVEDGQSLILGAEDRVVLTKRNDDGTRMVGDTTVVEVADVGGGVQPSPGASSESYEVGSHVKRLVCAEPSPDAISSLAWSSAASAGVFGQGQGSISAGLAESAASIGLRTGSIQILRDLGYRACEGLMNGVIGADGYSRLIGAADTAAIGLEALVALSTKPAAPAVAISSSLPGTTAKSTLTPGTSGGRTESTEANVTSGTAAAQITPASQNPTTIAETNAAGVVKVVCLTTIASPWVTASLQGKAQPKAVEPLVKACMNADK